MKDYNFSNNYENVDSWSIEKDVIDDSNELSYIEKLISLFRSNPNLLNYLKTKKVLYIPSLVILAGVGIVELISLFSILNIKKLESKHFEYEEKVISLNDINKNRENYFQNLIKHTSLMSNPSPAYLFAFLMQETIPKSVQFVDYTVDNTGFKLSAISSDMNSTKKFISLLLENKIIDNKTLKINRLVNQSSNREQGGFDDTSSNNESVVLEISGKLHQFSLKDRLILHRESQDLGTFKKLSTYSKLLELLR
ncbi:hypothetical protein N9U76_01940 [Prochlorococcus sp. AH-736-L19]|nr:hypothetical protein [Prochlorococcus sp. AH-736-L19]MDA9704179.1 hypothetical protein [Prochlorococcus sp. AH-736-L19]